MSGPADPSSFSLRLATPEDDAAVTGLLHRSYPPAMAHTYPEAVLAAALPAITKANPTLLASGSFYLAESAGGMVVGCGGWTRERPGRGTIEPGLAHLRHFATDPDWSGRGIGRALGTRCIADAVAAGLSRLMTFASLNAEGFYRALGFERIGPMAVAVAEGVRFEAVVMERDLEPSSLFPQPPE